jgi:hypothetical protein
MSEFKLMDRSLMNALAQKFGVVGYDDMEDNEL